MQINRLFEMIYLLLERRRITARELAERFEVSERTIYRDVEVLSSGGIPIYAVKGKGGGISLLDGYVLNKSVLSETEQKEILYALQGLSAARVPGSGDVLQKLGTIFRKTESNWIEVDFSAWGSGPEERENFEILKKAILEERPIHFVYYSSYGERSERTAVPRRLVFKNSSWYLLADCCLRADERLFKICRMEEISIDSTPGALQSAERVFQKKQDPYGPDNDPAEEVQRADPSREDLNCNDALNNGANPKQPRLKEKEVVQLQLRFPADMAFRVFETFDRRQVEKQENGEYIVTVCYPENSWVYSFLLSFGDKVRVLSPPHIQNILREKAAAVAAMYENEI